MSLLLPPRTLCRPNEAKLRQVVMHLCCFWSKSHYHGLCITLKGIFLLLARSGCPDITYGELRSSNVMHLDIPMRNRIGHYEYPVLRWDSDQAIIKPRRTLLWRKRSLPVEHLPPYARLNRISTRFLRLSPTPRTGNSLSGKGLSGQGSR